MRESDARFIVAARADVPDFAAAVLRLPRCISASDKIMELLLAAAEG